jgi:chromate reductase, NAD(P)H dehydrogenase (quinone)
MSTRNIIALSGSLRKGSFTSAVLRAAVKQAPAGLHVTVVDTVRHLPLYDEDLAEAGAGDAMRAEIRAADGILIATPEYNHHLPSPLKNWLDWASRPYGKHPLVEKPVAVFGVSPGPTGAKLAVDYLRSVLPALGAKLIGDELALGSIKDHLDVETGNVSDEVSASLATLLLAFQNSLN